jgi:hypothetical protein
LHTAAENDRSTRRQKKQLLNLVILSEAKDLLFAGHDAESESATWFRQEE